MLPSRLLSALALFMFLLGGAGHTLLHAHDHVKAGVGIEVEGEPEAPCGTCLAGPEPDVHPAAAPSVPVPAAVPGGEGPEHDRIGHEGHPQLSALPRAPPTQT